MDGELREKFLHKIRETVREFARARAERTYLEHFRESKKAILMKRAMVNGNESAAAQEREARADPEYVEVLEGLRDATEIESRLYWELRILEMKFEAWRTRMASARAERGRYSG